MLTAIIGKDIKKKKNPTVCKNMDIFTGIWGKNPDGGNDGTENKRADNVKSLFNKHSWDAAEVKKTLEATFLLTKKIC